jgi:hypothetical protein
VIPEKYKVFHEEIKVFGVAVRVSECDPAEANSRGMSDQDLDPPSYTAGLHY